MVRSSRQRTSKGTVELTTAINHQDIIVISRLLQSTTAGHTFFSSSHGTFTKTDHILGHKTHLNKLKRIKIILLDHSEIKLQRQLEL